MPFHKSHRTRVAEQMDADDADPQELLAALRFIRRINAALGYNRAMVGAVAREVDATPTHGTLSVLDVAAGSADLLLDLRAWAPTARPHPRAHRHRPAPRHARGGHAPLRPIDRRPAPARRCARPAVRRRERRPRHQHALPASPVDEAAVLALREMRRVARHAVVIADLIRSRRAYAWITLFTLTAGPDGSARCAGERGARVHVG
jgi:hypothetical protein